MKPNVPGFGLKASSSLVLRVEFLIPPEEIKASLLDLCVAAGGNKYDVALQYVTVRAQSIQNCNDRVERVLTQDLVFAEKLVHMARKPSLIQGRINEAKKHRSIIRARRSGVTSTA